MFCQNCGTKINENEKFCQNCGHQVTEKDFKGNFNEIKRVFGIDKKVARWKWVIVITLSIVALASGIWTAIGVFILGAIIVSILK